MDAILAASKISDQPTRDLVYYLLKKGREQDEKIAELERKQMPAQTIGFHHNPSTSSMEISFPKRSLVIGD